jgi:uncharacterized membrane protein
MKHWTHHPHLPDDRTGIERFVDFMGTKKFLWTQTAIVTLWVLLNTCVVIFQWDPYPFILLNLMFSTQAAYATPFILMAGKAEGRRASQMSTAQYDLAVKIHQHNISHVECDCQ